MQFEWTTRKPGAIPPRWRSLKKDHHHHHQHDHQWWSIIIIFSTIINVIIIMKLSMNLTREDCEHIVRWLVLLRRCSRMQKSCRSELVTNKLARLKATLFQNSADPITDEGVRCRATSIAKIYFNLCILCRFDLCLYNHLAPPPFLSTSVLASNVNLRVKSWMLHIPSESKSWACLFLCLETTCEQGRCRAHQEVSISSENIKH